MVQPTKCWQREIREKNLTEDLRRSGLTLEQSKELRISDFKFINIKHDDEPQKALIRQFITRHEWLGKMPQRPTHWFAAKYKDELAGAVVMTTPNAFSHLLGRENINLEKQIARGACISWSPKNLASWLIMKSIRWMIANTSFRYFTAYADTRALELGSIYQACNFIYLGKKSGSRFEYFDPANPKRGWFSDRLFRKAGLFRKLARENNISLDSNWYTSSTMHWSIIPDDIANKLRSLSTQYQSSCVKRNVPRKHKYVHIQGRSKRETNHLFSLFKTHNPRLAQKCGHLGLPYPKNRGM